MRCPQCDEPLLVLEFDGVEIDYCDACRGIWLDPEEMTALLGAGAQAALAPEPGEVLPKEAQRRCPRCRGYMRKRAAGAKSPVTVDLCRRGHGLWLDAGELRALVAQSPSDPVYGRMAAWLGEAYGIAR